MWDEMGAGGVKKQDAERGFTVCGPREVVLTSFWVCERVVQLKDDLLYGITEVLSIGRSNVHRPTVVILRRPRFLAKPV